jgi:hypothetical protein
MDLAETSTLIFNISPGFIALNKQRANYSHCVYTIREGRSVIHRSPLRLLPTRFICDYVHRLAAVSDYAALRLRPTQLSYVRVSPKQV